MGLTLKTRLLPTTEHTWICWDAAGWGQGLPSPRVCLHSLWGEQLVCHGQDPSGSVSSCRWRRKGPTGYPLRGWVDHEWVCLCHFLPTFFLSHILNPVWVTVHAISVETPKDVLRAARGESVTLPCTYQTSSLNREGFIQWDKLLRSHTVRIFKNLGASQEGVWPDHDLLEDKHYKVFQ